MFSQKSQQRHQEPTTQFKGIRFCSECDNMLEAREYKADEGQYFL